MTDLQIVLIVIFLVLLVGSLLFQNAEDEEAEAEKHLKKYAKKYVEKLIKKEAEND